MAGIARHIAGRHLATLALAAGLLGLATPALAQSSNAASEALASRALDLNTTTSSEVLGLSPTLSGALVDLPETPALAPIGAGVLDLSADCVTGRRACVDADAGERLDFGYSKPLNAGSVAGIDLELEPRGAVRFGDEESSALVGAVVRIGDDLRENGEPKSNTWYLFAGADAEAMTYAPGGAGAAGLGAGEFALQNRVIVGDAQAGIGYRIGESADVSVGYFRREVQSLDDGERGDDFSISEDAAAVSFTWRR